MTKIRATGIAGQPVVIDINNVTVQLDGDTWVHDFTDAVRDTLSMGDPVTFTSGSRTITLPWPDRRDTRPITIFPAANATLSQGQTFQVFFSPSWTYRFVYYSGTDIADPSTVEYDDSGIQSENTYQPQNLPTDGSLVYLVLNIDKDDGEGIYAVGYRFNAVNIASTPNIAISPPTGTILQDDPVFRMSPSGEWDFKIFYDDTNELLFESIPPLMLLPANGAILGPNPTFQAYPDNARLRVYDDNTNALLFDSDA